MSSDDDLDYPYIERIVDEAGAPEVMRCSENSCGKPVQAHARDSDGNILCFECAGFDPDEQLS